MNALIFIICITMILSKKFNYYNYNEITNIFNDLNNTCSQYIKVTDSKQKYNISLPQCGDIECKNLIVYMTDYSTYNIDKPHVI